MLRRLCRNDEEYEATLADMQAAIEKEKEGQQGWESILNPSPGVYLMLKVVITVAVIQQISGIEAIMYYTPVILKDAGIEDKKQNLMVTMLMGFAKTATIMVAAYLLDEKAGRRPLLIASLWGLSLIHI